jgi:hypothetical protein
MKPLLQGATVTSQRKGQRQLKGKEGGVERVCGRCFLGKADAQNPENMASGDHRSDSGFSQL